MSQAKAYGQYFPDFKPSTKTIREDAGLEDTLELIPQVVATTLEQTKAIAPTLKGRDAVETCRNIWEFCKRNFKYKPDEEGREEVRSPRRSWHDRHLGIDCDCFSTLISSILTNLGVPHKLRVTKYPDPEKPSTPASLLPYSHIYVVGIAGGREVPIDPVTDFFDFEQPYLAKTDINMRLDYLNGPPNVSVDRSDLGLDGLGLGRSRTRPAPNQRTNNTPATTQPPNQQRGRGVNIINRFNPAAILLRTGILLGMKLNMFNIAGNLRYAYLTDTQARSRGLNMPRMAHLRKVHAKLEKAVFLGGGKPENLKKAILEGKGNHDKAVPLNGLGLPSITPLGYGSDTSIQDILGPGIYQSESVATLNGHNGLGSLGEVTAAAAIAAATAMLGAIAAVLKSVGDVTKGGQPGAAAATEEAAITIPADASTVAPGVTEHTDSPATDPGSPSPEMEVIPQREAAEATVEPISEDQGSSLRTSGGEQATEPKKGIVQWAKDNPLLAFGVIPVAAATLGYVIWKAVQSKPRRGSPVNGLEGKPSKKPGKGAGKGRAGGGKGRKGSYTVKL